MSAGQFRDRIHALSVDIERQKEVLKQLETDKTLAQRQLNAILDPMARLPLEISSEIFVQCLPPVPEPGITLIPMLLLNVCNSWSHIALSTPALWASIHVQFPRPEGFDNGLENWLQRAGSHPLSISLHGSFDGDVAAVVREHAERLKSLEIFHGHQGEYIIDDPLRGVGPGPFPSLTSLTIGTFIHQDGDDVDYAFFDPNSIFGIFNLAPNLAECTLADVFPASEPALNPRAQLALPNLRRLRFRRRPANLESDDEILRYLTLPGLQTLFLLMSDVRGDDLISFLKRSLPPLRDLTLRCHDSDFSLLEQCLRLLPTLTHLELYGPGVHLVQGLFTVLADSPSSLLPHLQSLSIPNCWDHIPQSTWVELRRALSVRRTHFACVEITIRYTSSGPNAENCAAFRHLVDEGMKISIGDGEHNLIPI
ncbi:hypothetical protein DFH07DRAFT_459627 [Mycena maculata]|uniref:F-box domain-containing protein n=1 Tax=Mycena maculata TaxID=230809 RepID=A0AAD7J8F9_9AGAR|nr:hypothetical protein DFH07DRAFT_459627 [Mycena maculata]